MNVEIIRKIDGRTIITGLFTEPEESLPVRLMRELQPAGIAPFAEDVALVLVRRHGGQLVLGDDFRIRIRHDHRVDPLRAG